MDEHQTRLIAFAHLKNGKKPQEVADITGLTYAKALKLKKQLHEAEENDAIHTLFNMSETALEMLLDSVKKDLMPSTEVFGITNVLEGEIEDIKQNLQKLDKLDEGMIEAAVALSDRIKQQALIANTSDTLVNLADALTKLQIAFYGQGAHGPGGTTGALINGSSSSSGFEKYLKD